jgi:hypothetical protein
VSLLLREIILDTNLPRLALLALFFAGCSGISVSEGTARTPTDSETASAASTATTTATAEQRSTNTPVPLASLTPVRTPDFLALSISQDVLFLNTSEECSLPCWQGLRIGISSRNDIQEVFDTVFGFKGTIDFFNVQPEAARVWEADQPDLYTTGYEWQFDPDGTSLFSIQTVTDKTTGILKGIQFHISPRGRYPVTTPQEALTAFGEPDYIYVLVPPHGKIQILLQLTYKSGIDFHYHYVLATEFSEMRRKAELCLNSEPGVVEPGGAVYYLIEPFTDLWSEDRSLLQREWITDTLEGQEYRPIEEVMGISIPEFAALALQQEAPCLEIKD